MDLSKVLSQLREELEKLDAAILSLERLQQDGNRRGRPPKAPAPAWSASRPAGDVDAAKPEEASDTEP